MDDKYEELENIFEEKIEQIKNSNYEELLKICEQENIEHEELGEEELKNLLVDYFNEEIED